MSLSIVLVPAAIAAVSAAQAAFAKDDQGQVAVAVTTRMRDQGLLCHALTDIGARVTQHHESIEAEWAGATATFARDLEGVWSAHFSDNVTQDQATGLVTRLDQAYGRRVQQAVVARLLDQAPQAGMSVEKQTVEDDQSVTLVLNVSQGV